MARLAGVRPDYCRASSSQAATAALRAFAAVVQLLHAAGAQERTASSITALRSSPPGLMLTSINRGPSTVK